MFGGFSEASSPAGGFTAGVWVRDSTPPKMILVRSEAVARSTPTLQVRRVGKFRALGMFFLCSSDSFP